MRFCCGDSGAAHVASLSMWCAPKIAGDIYGGRGGILCTLQVGEWGSCMQDDEGDREQMR